jgi:hypothetical protein
MERLPGPNATKLYGLADASLCPARKTLEPLMRLEVARIVILGTTCAPIHPAEVKLLFEGAGNRLKRVNGFVRMVDLERLRMNLVHRHMKMLVLLLAMANRNVLVFL